MSTDIELETVNVGITGEDTVEVSKNLVEPCVSDNKDLAVEVNKKEYSIVGDGLYASVNTDAAPQWLTSIIDSVIDVQLEQGLVDLTEARTAIAQAISSIDLAKNNYAEAIDIIADIDQVILSKVEQAKVELNENIAANTDLVLTKVTANEALSIAANHLQAELNDSSSTIRSEISRIDLAVSNTNSSFAATTEALESNLALVDVGVEANATATNDLYTYVGYDGSGNSLNTGLVGSVEILQKQNDGVIETTTGAYDVIINADQAPTDDDELVVTAEPYASWKSTDVANGNEEQRSIHVGDVYIKYATNATGGKDYLGAYKFIKTVPDETSPYSTDTEGYTWAYISDNDAQNAYIAALNAYDLADGKRRVFVATPVAPYDEGDLWVRTLDGSEQIWRAVTGKLSGYSLGDWKKTATDDNAVTTLATGLENGTVAVDLSSATIDGSTPLGEFVADQVDNQVVVYSGTNVATQTGMKTDDIYIEKKVDSSGAVPVDVVNTYKYNGSSWVQIGNNSNLTALADLADGKRSVYAGSTTPEAQGYAPVERDIWIPESSNGSYVKGEVYQYNGSAWLLATKYTEDLDNFVDTVYQPTIVTLQNQVDGKIEYYFYSNLSTSPLATVSSGWGEAEHGNVVYYKDTDEGYWYNSSIDSFETLIDTSMLSALKKAEDSQATADGKITTFYGTRTGTTAEGVGDLLIATDEGNKQYRWDGAAWVAIQDQAIVANAGEITNLSTELTNGTNTWASADSTLENTLNTSIRGNAVSAKSASEMGWTAIVGNVAGESDLEVGGCHTGKTYAEAVQIASSYGVRLPTLAEVQAGVAQGTGCNFDNTKVWTSTIAGDGLRYVVNGNYTDASVEARLETATADVRFAADVDNSLYALEAKSQSNFAYNSTLTMNGVTYDSGFGLATSLTAGSGLPVGESEFWVSAEKFRVVSGSSINSLGSLAISDTVGYAELTGTKPPTDADSTISSINSGLVLTADTGGITFNEKGSVKSQNYDLSTNNGVFMGWGGTQYEFMVGNTLDYLRWDGSTIDISGSLTAKDSNGSDYLLVGKKASNFLNESFLVGLATEYNDEVGIGAYFASVNNTDGFLYSVRADTYHGRDAFYVSQKNNFSSNEHEVGVGYSLYSSVDDFENIYNHNYGALFSMYRKNKITAPDLLSNEAGSVVGYRAFIYGGSGEAFGVKVTLSGSPPSNMESVYDWAGPRYGVWSSATLGTIAEGTPTPPTYDFYAAGSGTIKASTVSTFTGQHDAIIDENDVSGVGDIMVDKSLWFSDGVNDTVFLCQRSIEPLEKAVGVLSSSRSKDVPWAAKELVTDTRSNISQNEERPSEIIEAPKEGVTMKGVYSVLINSLGEGQVNVCGEGGDFKNGDLIVTSSIPGKGMRQNKEDGTPDDVIRNVTVAKVRGDWSFESPDEIKMIPCIYLCG